MPKSLFPINLENKSKISIFLKLPITKFQDACVEKLRSYKKNFAQEGSDINKKLEDYNLEQSKLKNLDYLNSKK